MSARSCLSLALPHYHAGRLDEAERALREGIAREPGDAEAVHFLGVILCQRGQADEGLGLIQASLQMRPQSAAFWSNAAEVLRQLGDLANAEPTARHAVELDPRLGDAHANLGIILGMLGRIDEGIVSLTEGVRLAPQSVNARMNLARLLLAVRRWDEARREAKVAVDLAPQHAEAKLLLGAASEHLGRITLAEEQYRAATVAQPRLAEAWSNLASILRVQGRLEEAIDAAAAAHKLAPANAGIHSNLLFTLNGSSRPADEIFAAHRGFASIHETPAPSESHADGSQAKGKLRIGYVSPDFREHAVMQFLWPLLEHFDRERFEVFCYGTTPSADETTGKVAALSHWRNTAAMSDDAAAELIGRDQINIVIDLAGHTAGNRLPLFARRPAPVQATYLGYPGTTGLSTIDWRISDWQADPIGSSENFCSEKLMRVPCAWCFAPPADSPEPAQDAADSPITFGSFAAVSKVGKETIRLWAAVLRAVPGSRMLLKSANYREARVRERVLEAFESAGVERSRVEILPAVDSVREHLSLYGRVDIALDTYPYAGTATTCEALWMGVPVITRAGDRHISRVGASLLTASGFAHCVARSDEEFVATTARLAGDLDRRTTTHRDRREQMRMSALMNAPRFVRDMEIAYQSMFETRAR